MLHSEVRSSEIRTDAPDDACLRAYMQAYRFTSQKLRHGGPLHLRPVFGVANPAKGEFTDRPKHVYSEQKQFVSPKVC